MYMEDDTMTPRDRISDNMLRRMLDDSQGNCPMCDERNRDAGRDRGRESWGLGEGYPLSMVFAPIQAFRKLYDCEIALQKGTIFEELNFPFMGETVSKGGNCRG